MKCELNILKLTKRVDWCTITHGKRDVFGTIIAADQNDRRISDGMTQILLINICPQPEGLWTMLLYRRSVGQRNVYKYEYV